MQDNSLFEQFVGNYFRQCLQYLRKYWYIFIYKQGGRDSFREVGPHREARLLTGWPSFLLENRVAERADLYIF